MAEICWNCKYFEHNNEQGIYSGRCRRHAPRGVDMNGFGTFETAIAVRLQAGIVGATIFKAASDPLLALNYDSSATMPTGKSATGYEAHDVFPLLVPAGYKAVSAVFCASLVNTGAATVGAAPTMDIELYSVVAGSVALVGTGTIVFDQADVGVEGNTTPQFVKKTVNFSLLYPDLGNKLIAIGVKLVDDDEDLISEVQDPMVCIEASKNLSVDLDEYPFPWVVNGNIVGCGEFEQNNDVIPPLP